MKQEYDDMIDIGVDMDENSWHPAVKQYAPWVSPVKQMTPPTPNKEVSVADEVMKDMSRRKAFGVQKYGTPLQPNNGRDALQDLYEELLDACCYAKQRLLEESSSTSPSA